MPYAENPIPRSVTIAAPTVLDTPAPFAAITKNSQIEGVGVYESSRGNTNSHQAGVINITVKKTKKPITLVLCSYEPIIWKISKEPGAIITTILVSGYYEQKVFGVDSVRATNIGSAFAYDNNKNNALNEAVFRATGRPIDIFQGKYTGTDFTVGGV
jgi:hypothetical protein